MYRIQLQKYNLVMMNYTLKKIKFKLKDQQLEMLEPFTITKVPLKKVVFEEIFIT